MLAAETSLQDRPSLSPRQRDVLALIVDCIAARGYPPTIREICRHFGFRSTNGVSDHIKALVRKGYLTHEQCKSRTLRPVTLPAPKGARRVQAARGPGGRSAAAAGTMAGVPMLGRIAAGLPILAPDEARPEENVWVDQSWLGANDEVYALKVSGDSMVDDGILDGDTVFVRRCDDGQRGEIVVVSIDNEVTIKRYYPEAGRIRLQPANARMQPIYLYPTPGQQARIMGVVIGVYRRL